MKHGKKYVDSLKAIDTTKAYESMEALDLSCKNAKAKFDETIEVHVRLGVDSRHADQQVRGAVILPNGTGKKVRVCVFCKEEKYDAAKEAQGMLEMKISKLKDSIATSKVIDESQLDTSKVAILTTVRLKNLTSKGEQKFTIVPDNESDLKAGKISVSTPIAKGLLGKAVGEKAEIALPNGNQLHFEVLEITL